MTTALEALIARLQSEPPSAELDCCIWQHTHPDNQVLAYPGSIRPLQPPKYVRLADVDLAGWEDHTDLASLISAPLLTSNLEDAVSFVMRAGATGYTLYVSPDGASAVVMRNSRTGRGWTKCSSAANAEMALLSAVLQAPPLPGTAMPETTSQE